MKRTLWTIGLVALFFLLLLSVSNYTPEKPEATEFQLIFPEQTELAAIYETAEATALVGVLPVER